MSQQIPTPPSIPFIGHAATLEKELPLHSLNLLTKQYGEIFQLNMMGGPSLCSHLRTSQLTKHPYTGTKVVHISTQRLLHEVSDEKRFRKTMSTISWQVRNATGDGLFTVSCIPFSPPITYYTTDSYYCATYVTLIGGGAERAELVHRSYVLPALTCIVSETTI